MNGRQVQSADTATIKRKAAPATDSAYSLAPSSMAGWMNRLGNQELQAMFRSAQAANAPQQSRLEASTPALSLRLDTQPGGAEGRGRGLPMDATRSSILPAATNDMTDAELVKQIDNLNTAIEAEPPTSLLSSSFGIIAGCWKTRKRSGW